MEKTNNRILVFVYGTLRRGAGNYRRFLEGKPGVRFVGVATTVNSFHMMAPSFPVLLNPKPEDTRKTEIGGPYPVLGEVFEVDDVTLVRLDQLEGVSFGMYDRAQEPVMILEEGNGLKVVNATIYIGTDKHWLRQTDWCRPVTPTDGKLDWMTWNDAMNQVEEEEAYEEN